MTRKQERVVSVRRLREVYFVNIIKIVAAPPNLAMNQRLMPNIIISHLCADAIIVIHMPWMSTTRKGSSYVKNMVIAVTFSINPAQRLDIVMR
jgi:hypothetical protein